MLAPPAVPATIEFPFAPAVVPPASTRPRIVAVDPDEDDEPLDDDLPVAEPAEEESDFDDFDDEFDDDFEEEESDPDWDHPDEAEPSPPGKDVPKRK